MFSYYGSKSKIVDYYPKPRYNRIIEPFAGSARYSLKYWDNDVTICDKNSDVIDVWKWLQTCSPNDILGLPKLYKGMDIRFLNITDIERKFLSYFTASGRPSNIVTKFMDHDNHNQNRYKRIADRLFCIRHWEILRCSYEDLQNTEATWFIDPPYQYGGEHYKESAKNIDFKSLSKWCLSRRGQTIVCENTKANWLPFRPMVEIQGACQTHTTEAIWSNLPTNYDILQSKLEL
jgi:site-specific DNA-adenine methylase